MIKHKLVQMHTFLMIICPTTQGYLARKYIESYSMNTKINRHPNKKKSFRIAIYNYNFKFSYF